MNTFDKRVLTSVLISGCLLLTVSTVEAGDVEKWEMLERSFSGPGGGNPYTDVEFSATFRHVSSNTKRSVDGFYDGNGTYRLRFMPTKTGKWTYRTDSSAVELDRKSGQFNVDKPTGNNHGPVVRDPDSNFHFIYADGTRFYPFGTTIYGMAQVEEKKYQMTLETLENYGTYKGVKPFTKVRLSATPHDPTASLDPNNDQFRDRHNEDLFLGSDKSRLNHKWFKLVDRAVEDLLERQIQADLILFHSNANPDPESFSDAQADRLTDYIVARYGAYRNVWWSLANELHFVGNWSEGDWNRIGNLIREEEFFRHLASIHTNKGKNKQFSWEKNWVTHISVQRPVEGGSTNPDRVRSMRKKYNKPYIDDEYEYEGDPDFKGWGDLPPEQATRGPWKLMIGGGYATHGETLEQQFFRGGGKLHGESPKRIAFMRWIFQQSPADRGLEPLPDHLHGTSKGKSYYLYYYDENKPAEKTYEIPTDKSYRVDVIDTWNMTITDKGVHSGTFTISLPGRNFITVRMKRAGGTVSPEADTGSD